MRRGPPPFGGPTETGLSDAIECQKARIGALHGPKAVERLDIRGQNSHALPASGQSPTLGTRIAPGRDDGFQPEPAVAKGLTRKS